MEHIMATSKEAGAKFLELKIAQGNLVFTLGNGSKVTFDPRRVNDATREQGMYHGFGQKIRDAAAGFSKEKDFEGAEANMQSVIDALYANQWNRQGGGAGAGVVMEDMAAAIARIKKVTHEKALAAVTAATPDQRATWAKNATVAQYMAESKAARLAKAAEGKAEDLEIEGLEGMGE